jgi:uncharacterized secreted repeat protein (TIGR03808 family)
MDFARRRLLAISAAAATIPAATTLAQAAPSSLSALGVDATQFGVFPGSPDDQTRAMQRAIDRAAGARVPLALHPGVYRVGQLKASSDVHLVGVRGATRLILTQGPSLLECARADSVTLSGITFDGAGRPLGSGRGLVHLAHVANARVTDCEMLDAGEHGLFLDGVEGEVRGNKLVSAAQAGLFSIDARGLVVAGNTVRGCGNNGIQVWRSEEGEDGTLIVGNRIEEIAARAGGSGQNGNAINVFRAGAVHVGQNRIGKAAFSAVRGNAASNLQIIGNSASACGEVAIYAEFGFEGAVIAHNTIDGAALGVVVTNFNHGGRMAVVQGNVIRRLATRRPAGTDPGDSAGIGIGVEADTAVTGNVIEDAPTAGIMLGWGQHMRDLTVTGNVVRRVGVGVSVSVSPGAGAAVIADNMIADAKSGAIVGMDRRRRVTGDLARDGAGRYAHLEVSGNRVR